MLATPRLSAVEVTSPVSRYVHEFWGAEQGFPGGAVHAISQTADGYLWIGGEKGLVRFDGFSFHLMTAGETAGISASPIQQMAADAQGQLWIMQQNMTLAVSRHGRFGTSTASGELTGATSICRTQDGDILATNRGAGIVVYRARSRTATPLPEALRNILVISIAETSDGTIWLGTRDAGLAALHKDGLVRFTSELPDRKINTLLAVGNEVWVGTDSGLTRWDGKRFSASGLPVSLRTAQILALATDRFRNVWAGTGKGLQLANEAEHAAHRPNLRPTTIAGGAAVNAILEDREGDLWLGTDEGVERLRESAFVGFRSVGGLKARENGPVFVDGEGRTWFSNPQAGLFWRRGSKEEQVRGFEKDTIYSIYGRGGDIWVGRKYGGLTLVRCHDSCEVVKTYTHRDGLAENAVFTVFADNNSVWAGTVSSGISRLLGNKLITYTAADGVSSNAINAIAGSPEGTIWVATPEGLSAFTGRSWRKVGAADGLPPGSVNCLAVDASNRLWIGTSKGLAVSISGKISTFSHAPGLLRDPVIGIAADRAGSLWVATPRHILRVDGASLLGSPQTPVELREYGAADGLPGGLNIRRDRSVFLDAQGSIWFSTERGLCMVEPSRLHSESVPALVHIQSISADGASLPLASEVSVPPRHKRLTLSFVGLSLSVPERIRFRYKLDEFDRDWSAASATREAVYTNLNPGSYRFRVVASNASGIWNSEGAGLTLRIEPAFWQTWWFRIIGVFGLALLIAALYRLRLHQITSQLDLRFEERLAERTRIAQELHDTLLQGFLSASMQMHVAFGRLDENSPARAPLSRAIELMGRASKEGRAALRQLRSDQAGEPNLEQALSGIPKEISASSDIAFHLRVEGRQQTVRPVLRDDVYRICREAILNALRHSRASGIEVEVAYAAHHLRVHVQDNGCGIDPHVLEFGRDGHWGLKGMRERAERIGARLSVLSSPGAGTEVVLSVPGQIAFQPGEPVNHRRRFHFVRPKWKTKKEAAAPLLYDRDSPD